MISAALSFAPLRCLRASIVASVFRPPAARRPSLGVRRLAGPAPEAAAVEKIGDPADPRLVLYRRQSRRDHPQYLAQVQELTGVAQAAADKAPAAVRRTLQVHYGWDCLERLVGVQAEQEDVFVASVLLRAGAPAELRRLALAVAGAGRVFEVGEGLSYDFCLDLAWGEPVRYVVVWAPRPLRRLRPPALVLDLRSSQNLGQVVRSAVLLGVRSFVLSRASWGCLNGRAGCSSAGWLYAGRFHVGEPLADAVCELRAMGLRLYAAEESFGVPVAPHGGAGWALVVGNEQQGISPEVVRLCDARVCVSQRRGASLNVAHAASICLYELGRHAGA